MLSIREQARHEVAELVERYRRLDAKSLRAYNEANTGKDFILPLFRALGWDVYNSAEVSAERKVSRGRVDYAFRLGGIPKLFLEAKRFAADLEDPRWSRQVINYAWIKGVTWAVLTDFEGLKVFNAEWKEANPVRNIFIDLTCDQYLDEFDRLWLLSREGMAEGRIDQEALRVGKKLKKSPIGDQLFGELVRWREKLHYYLRRYNPDFSDDQIDEAVQRILDRLIFIRTCEDRGIEAPTLRPLLREWQDGGRRKDLAKLLRGVFRDFDEGYDAQLFAPHFCEGLESEPTPYEEIIEGLYATPDGIIEYDFNAIDVDVLGGIYEQYLGYVAKVAERRERRGLMERLKRPKEEKPPEIEIIERKGWRKKHGIYYTPQFVVRYIVANTLGKLLGERTYNEVKQLKVLDPACGSGSFLIEAFDVLDKYHRRVRGDYDEFDFFRRAEILTGNIYGVDLDAQAVEIARLNLLLKTLNQRARLPDLVDNIRQGNSLISGTPEELREYFGEDWEEKRPFNWEEEFPQIMAPGGFDVIVGNPPYVRAERMAKDERAYWQKSSQFDVIYGRFDIFILFVERAIKLLREGGRLGFIVPFAALNQNYAKKLRSLILQTCCIESIVDLSVVDVFQEAAVETCILVLRKTADKGKRAANRLAVVRIEDAEQDIAAALDTALLVRQANFQDTPYNAFRLELGDEVVAILEKMRRVSHLVGDLCYVDMGLISYYKGKGVPGAVGKESFISRRRVDSSYYPYAEGKDLPDRYHPISAHRYIRYAPPLMHRPKFPELFESPKVVVSKITGDKGLRATLDRTGIYTESTLNCCVLKHHLLGTGRVTAQEAALSENYEPEYILGLLNSTLLGFYYKSLIMRSLDVYPDNVRQLPIRRIDFDNPEEKKMHDDLVARVERMLELNRRLKDAMGREREELERKIERTDGEIDESVYRLYGLMEEEIAVMEAP